MYYLESFSKVLKVVLLLWFGVFYPSLEFFSFEVSLVMTFLVSFSFTCRFIFIFSISFGRWGVLDRMIGFVVWCNFSFWDVGCRSLRRDDMTSDQFLVTWDMWII